MANTKAFFDPRPIMARNAKAAERVVIYTAQNIQREAKRSMKSGGKSYKVSKPGDPPRAHRGTLKNLTRWQKISSTQAIVGPERVGNGREVVPRVLEKGGTVVPDKTIRRLKSDRPRRQFKPEAVRNSYVNKHGESRKNRPRLKRSINKATRPGRYNYFYSTARWEAARNSAGFQEWARSVTEEVRVKSFRIENRPYMTPALKKVTSQESLAKIYASAFKKG